MHQRLTVNKNKNNNNIINSSSPSLDITVPIFLVCFASFENVATKWYPEVSHYCSNTPIILVGTKVDLVTDAGVIQKLITQGLAPITYVQGEKLRKSIGATDFILCSAIARIGIEDVFECAVRAVIQNQNKLKTKKRHAVHCCDYALLQLAHTLSLFTICPYAVMLVTIIDFDSCNKTPCKLTIFNINLQLVYVIEWFKLEKKFRYFSAIFS